MPPINSADLCGLSCTSAVALYHLLFEAALVLSQKAGKLRMYTCFYWCSQHAFLDQIARFLTCAPFVHSGPIRAYILARKDAIQFWRTLMGPTRVFQARHVAPDSIRGSFGLTDTRNTTHGSGEFTSSVRSHK